MKTPLSGPELVRAGWQASSAEEKREIWRYVFEQLHSDAEVMAIVQCERDTAEAGDFDADAFAVGLLKASAANAVRRLSRDDSDDDEVPF